MGAPNYDLSINAEVHTTANSPSGPIDSIFTHSLEGTLGTTIITWEEALLKTEPGTLSETVVVTDPNLPNFRRQSIVVTGVLLVIFLFVAWHAIQARPVLSEIKLEALRAKKKHKNVIVDVQKLPTVRHGEVIIPINSLEELIKVSDSLMKPVLHQVEADKHTYCVIDGLTMYEYLSKAWYYDEEETTKE
jgi:hypothetical protein